MNLRIFQIYKITLIYKERLKILDKNISNLVKNLKINIIDVLSKKLDKKQKGNFDREDVYGITPLVLAIKKGLYKLAVDIVKGGFYKRDRVWWIY